MKRPRLFYLIGGIAFLGICVIAGNLNLTNWRYTGSMHTSRSLAGVVKLTNGKVLVVGGKITLGPAAKDTATCEIFDPKTDTWSETGTMNEARTPFVYLIPDGRVLAFDGYTNSNLDRAAYEIYDPVWGKWTLFHSKDNQMGMIPGQQLWSLNQKLTSENTLKLYSVDGDGKKSVGSTEIGGVMDSNFAFCFADKTHGMIYGSQRLFIYDVKAQKWTIVAAPGINLEYDYSIKSMGVGSDQVIIAHASPGLQENYFIYNLKSNRWKALGAFQQVYSGDFVLNGMLFMCGGGIASHPQPYSVPPSIPFSGFINNALLWFSGIAPPVVVLSTCQKVDLVSGKISLCSGLNSRRVGCSVVVLDDGRVLVVGGADNSRKCLNSCEIIDSKDLER